MLDLHMVPIGTQTYTMTDSVVGKEFTSCFMLPSEYFMIKMALMNLSDYVKLSFE